MTPTVQSLTQVSDETVANSSPAETAATITEK